LIFDEKGYINLIDLGVAKLFHNDKENIDSSGTPGYMAPEVINNSHHNFTADYFSIGVIIYEIIFKQV
jgi:serine/threonine protein kinase